MIAVAVNETEVPAQMLVLLAAMLTDGVTGLEMLIVIAFELPVELVRHGAFEVITHETISLFDSDEVEYVVLLVPTLLPFSFH